MLASHGDTACANKRIVYEVPLLAVSLIRHQKCQFVVGARWSKVWPLLQVVSTEKCVIIVVFARFLTLSLCRNHYSAVNSTIDSIFNYFVDYLRIVQINILVNKGELFEHFDYVELLSH